MPNWCRDVVAFIGPTEIVEKAAIKVRSNAQVISFHNIVPQPNELDITSPAWTEEEKEQAEKNKEQFGHKDWYDWRCSNWGTKWDASEPRAGDMEQLADGNSYQPYEFDTAWGPPAAVFEELSRMFPELLIMLAYDEPGCDFSGVVWYRAGMIVDKQEMRSVSYVSSLLDGDDADFEYKYDTSQEMYEAEREDDALRDSGDQEES